MKALVVGLGSMGKRRVRCLKLLGVNDITGVDLREDRRNEAGAKYGIKVSDSLSAELASAVFDIAVISLPPKSHVAAMQLCIDKSLPFFVEASVVDEGLAEVIERVQQCGLVAAPSTTLHFHPAIREISRIVQSGQLGKISNVMLHSGQYLPDWHTYESVSEYYVSDPVTGGAREIVPFEMTWFTGLFGFPHRVAANYRKTIDIEGAGRIEDTYNCLLDYGGFLAVLTVDVVSRHATRRLVINGSKQQLVWSWDEPIVRLFDGASGEWRNASYEMEASAPGYNKNIGENMYIDEIRAFLDAVRGARPFPNTLADDHRILKLLYSLEQSHHLSTFVEVAGK